MQGCFVVGVRVDRVRGGRQKYKRSNDSSMLTVTLSPQVKKPSIYSGRSSSVSHHLEDVNHFLILCIWHCMCVDMSLYLFLLAFVGSVFYVAIIIVFRFFSSLSREASQVSHHHQISKLRSENGFKCFLLRRIYGVILHCVVYHHLQSASESVFRGEGLITHAMDLDWVVAVLMQAARRPRWSEDRRRHSVVADWGEKWDLYMRYICS